MRPAVELSYLTKEDQEILYGTMESETCTPSHAQAIKIRKFSAKCRLNNEEVLLSIMSEEKPNQVEQWKIPKNRLKKYFPSRDSQQKMEKTIIKALELYRKRVCTGMLALTTILTALPITLVHAVGNAVLDGIPRESRIY